MSGPALIVLGCLCLLGLFMRGTQQQRRLLVKVVAAGLLILAVILVWMVLSPPARTRQIAPAVTTSS